MITTIPTVCNEMKVCVNTRKSISLFNDTPYLARTFIHADIFPKFIVQGKMARTFIYAYKSQVTVPVEIFFLGL